MTENKKIEQLKKRIDKVFDKITTDEIEQRIKEDKLLDEEMELMTENKKIEQLIAHNVKSLTISKEKYEKLRTETKNLIKLNDVKLNFEDDDRFIKISDQLIGGYHLNIVYDKETKVEYAFYGKGGLQILIDAEGNPLLYKEGE